MSRLNIQSLDDITSKIDFLVLGLLKRGRLGATLG